ncbi:glycoside-pentoside-hexuronide (GPH):cation symporter [Corynebacterium breve]|uniref:Glycoside-pentoside-hexuronide (GPH):cation symporter n=1 Tax=Corynebacterium breve TaxID=3049799 RepID=A0ABY8VG92_9CORY|nr:cytidylate kinase family protein [Corynebacterium breve]WIM67234.1 glycoside-pentoside-hexuronide (GPH):cation symporter [Corynebacterium breve]
MSTTTQAAPPATGRMPNHRVLTYTFGDVANNLSFMMTSMFLMVYMTDIAGLTAGVAGAIYGITKIWAGFADLIAGQTVDRFDTRWGRLRPWILFGSTPLAIVFVLLFSTPAGLGPTATIAWIFLFDAAFQLAYSFVNIPYGSLSAAMTQDPVDRSKLSGARSIASSLTGVILSAVVAPQFQDTQADGIRMKFTLTCIALGVLAVILYLICFANSREVVPRGQGQISLKNTLKMVKQNKPLLVLCSGAFFLLTSIFIMNAVGLYFARDVLGNAKWFTFLMLAQTLGTILAASFVPTITARFGKRNGYIAFGILIAVAFTLIFFLPSASLVPALIAWFLYGAGSGGTNAMMFSMQADTVDYGEWKTGIRSEGGSYSILSFVRKVGQGVGGWAGGAIIGAFGYASGAAAQSEEALRGIRVAAGVAPAVFALLAVLVMVLYPLTLQQHEKIITDLNERRTQSAIGKAKGVDVERTVNPANVGDGRSTLLRKADANHPPIVTLFGLRGSGATDIAPILAKELGVEYIGQRFSSTELSQVDKKDLISDSTFDRWMRAVSSGGLQDGDLATASEQSANHNIAAENTNYVLNAVENGGVLLGRNGALVLGDVVGAYHVRLVAPIDKRVERVMQQTGLSEAEAREQCITEDRIRAEMSDRLYNWNPNHDSDYDLVINTASVTYEQVAEFIAYCFRSKYPESKPNAASREAAPGDE